MYERSKRFLLRRKRKSVIYKHEGFGRLTSRRSRPILQDSRPRRSSFRSRFKGYRDTRRLSDLSEKIRKLRFTNGKFTSSSKRDNPFVIVKTNPGFRGGRRFTLPGHNYAGPGNDNYLLKPKNRFDRIARDHDLGYGELNGLSYFTHTKADDRLLRFLGKPRTMSEKVGYYWFNAKKAIAPRYETINNWFT